MITATEVYWPTAEAIQVYSLTPHKGALHQPRLVRSIDLKSSGFTGGNLVFAQGKLVLATAERLVLFSK